MYGIIVMFEWDENKRLRNLEKHNLDFKDVALLFDGRPTVTETAISSDEMRHVTTAAMNDGKFYTVIWTWRESNRRIISFRRARNVEKRTYREIYG
jgi:uncharacterized protein